MQRPVRDACIGRAIDRVCDRSGELHNVGVRQPATFSQHDVERIADGVLLRQKRGAALEAGRQRPHDRRMLQAFRN